MSSKKSKSNKSTAAHAPLERKYTILRRPVNIQIVQKTLLIWLDNNIDMTRDEYQHVLTHLYQVVENVTKYTDSQQCIEFIKKIENEKICMIVSGSLGEKVMPEVHNMSQVNTIFIFCGNKKYHEKWAKEWSKISGVFTKIEPMCEALKKATQRYEQEVISISILPISNDMSQKSLDQLELPFVYTEILGEILFSIKFEQQHINEFIQYCLDISANNSDQLKIVKEFQRQYREQTSIWWYTCEPFLYGMLNRALQLMEIDMIIRMGFFIADLHRHIEQLYQKRFGGHKFVESFIVYHGQGMSQANFEQLSKTKGGLLSFNSFLSTTMKQDVSLAFANSASTNTDTVGVLFEMIIDPTQPNVPFAFITDVDHLQDIEDEVLFSMRAVFRIGKIALMGENIRLFQVKLTLVRDDDKDLRVLIDRIREKTLSADKGWLRLGEVSLKMEQFDKSQEVYEKLLEQTTDELERGHIYEQLGQANHNKQDYQEAIQFFVKSLEIKKKILLPTDPGLAVSHSRIGNAYYSMGDYSKALSSHEKALAIRQQALSSQHTDLASSYNNIGLVYDSMGDYSKALSSHEKALAIWQQTLPSNHPNLAVSYNNIGVVYEGIGDYSKALASLETALEIRLQSLPPNDPHLASSYDNIGLVYDSMDDDEKALFSHAKALAIRQQSLPPNHPQLAMSYNNIGLVYDSVGDYEKALSYHEKALAIRQQSLPPNHPDLGSSYNNIGKVYEHMNRQSDARSFYGRAVANGECLLPADHPILQQRRKNLRDVQRNCRDYCVLYEE